MCGRAQLRYYVEREGARRVMLLSSIIDKGELSPDEHGSSSKSVFTDDRLSMSLWLWFRCVPRRRARESIAGDVMTFLHWRDLYLGDLDAIVSVLLPFLISPIKTGQPRSINSCQGPLYASAAQ